MAIRTVTAATVIVETSDISNWTGNLSDTPGMVTVQPYTPFGGGGYVQRAAGLKSGTWAADGWSDHGATGVSNLITPANLGSQFGASVAVPATGNTPVAGDWCQFVTGKLTKLDTANFTQDTIAPFAIEVQTDGPFVNSGRVGAPLASYTTAGLTGTAVALLGPVTGKSIYAILHVTAAAGTNLAVKVQSDDSAGFTTPTDRITFSTVSAVGRQSSAGVAGPLNTETHWRVLATIATGTFSFACYFGIA